MRSRRRESRLLVEAQGNAMKRSRHDLRRARRVSLCAVVVISTLAFSSALRCQPLTGSLEIGGATPVDPPADERQDTHLRLVLTGASAKALYQRLPVRAVTDACLGAGTQSKVVDAIRCTRTGSRHECDFSIDLATQRLQRGQAC